MHTQKMFPVILQRTANKKEWKNEDISHRKGRLGTCLSGQGSVSATAEPGQHV